MEKKYRCEKCLCNFTKIHESEKMCPICGYINFDPIESNYHFGTRLNVVGNACAAFPVSYECNIDNYNGVYFYTYKLLNRVWTSQKKNIK